MYTLQYHSVDFTLQRQPTCVNIFTLRNIYSNVTTSTCNYYALDWAYKQIKWYISISGIWNPNYSITRYVKKTLAENNIQNQATKIYQ